MGNQPRVSKFSQLTNPPVGLGDYRGAKFSIDWLFQGPEQGECAEA
jgi:hypothetical protein